MNITGYGQYSKGVAGARDPKKLMNSQLKLIFIYPILIADKIKVQSTPPFEQLIRDFISVTFLSDLFIENAFTIIGTANQIRPLWDERQQSVDPTSGILRTLAAQQGISSAGYGTASPNYNVDAAYAGVLQQKITQKTAVIQQLIKTDPKLAKFRPYIETITMGNMIEVPVIVGTSSFQVDTLTLMWVLIASIGLNLSLDSETNIDAVFKELESLDEKKYWRLLNNLITDPTVRQNLGSWFQRGVIGISRGVERVTRRFNILPSLQHAASNKRFKIQSQIDNEEELKTQQQFIPLYLNRTDLDNTKTYFKFVLNRTSAERRFGLDATDERTSRVRVQEASLGSQSIRYRNFLINSFTDIMGTTGTIWLLSIGNLISISSSGLNVVNVKKEKIDDELFDNITDIVGKLFANIDKSFRQENIKEKIESLKDLCAIDSVEVVENISRWAGDTSISVGSFNNSTYLHFVDMFEKASGVSKSLSVRLEKQLQTVVADTYSREFNSNLIVVKNLINQVVKNFIKEFVDEEDQTPDSEFTLENLGIADRNKILRQVIPAFHDGIVDILYFLFLAKFQEVLCKFILIADVEIEKSVNEVTSWPNYTLVLPVEIVVALHAAIMGKSWKHMLSGGQIGRSLQPNSTPLTKKQVNMPDVSATYIKSIVKFIANRLNVPNLIVVDSKRGEVHYQLMNQTDVNKSRIQTLATFVQSKVDRPLTTTQSQNYY
jgi:hypothetical protein